MLHLMATPAQLSSLISVPPMPVMKWISPLSLTSYLPLLDTFLNIMYLIIGGDMNTQISKGEND